MNGLCIWTRYHKPKSLPRPFILARLRDAWNAEHFPNTVPMRDQLQKLGEPFGADELEYEAFLQEVFDASL